MASLPPQHPASQRTHSPPEDEVESSAAQHRAPITRTSSFGASSVDSQTLLLNSPQPQSPKADAEAEAEAEAEAKTEAQDSAPPQSAAPQPQPQSQEDEGPRICWICFNDETEDDATTSEWRSPCPCALVAHEKCLLDWIADMEAPSSRQRTGNRAGKILCPQCKSEIKIQRPTSVVVKAAQAIDSFTGTLLLPGFAFVTGTALYATLAFAGTHTIYAIFGTQDAMQILGPLYQTPDPGVQSVALRLASHVQRHWRLDLGLPMIPVVLIASRTTLADSFLPFLPLIFFVSSGQPGDEMLQLQWPPSAAFAFATLPYIRGFYNAYYDRVWAPREQRWLKEVQPRAGTDEAEVEAGEAQDHAQNHANADDDVVEIQVDLNIFEDLHNNGGDAEDDADDLAVPQGLALQDDHPPPQINQDDAAPAPDVPAAAQPRRQRVRRDANVAFNTTSVADTILGALIFPSIAAAMGELLAHTLPSSWVNPSSGLATSWFGWWAGVDRRGGKATGFLQTRWGRSLVGGCLFVGLKDALWLYVRWKMAQSHRRRRVLDCDKGPGGRTRTRGTAGAQA
jgi:hypothetical protein